MMKDTSGNELTIAQSLMDALKISDAEFQEYIGKVGDGNPAELVGMTINYHRAQVVSCLEAVATLESYLRGLQGACGIDEVPYTGARGHLGPIGGPEGQS